MATLYKDINLKGFRIFETILTYIFDSVTLDIPSGYVSNSPVTKRNIHKQQIFSGWWDTPIMSNRSSITYFPKAK